MRIPLLAAAALCLSTLVACTQLPATHEVAQEPAPVARPCPAAVPAGTRCLAGTDSAGAHYIIALPAGWAGDLVLHAHGGPTLGPPRLERVEEDLARWAVVLRAGYAWAGSSFRQGGVAVRAAAEDTERLRRIVIRHVGQPRFTVLHGQSWGASVAAVGASMHAQLRPRPYDAVLLTSGVLGGGPGSYTFRLDLRSVYQALCGNHPRPDEPQYPLWMGLPQGATLQPADLRRRVDDCLGLDKPPAARSADQQRKVDTIVRAIHIPASAIHGHLAWATWHFQDIAQRLPGLGSPFDNHGARYTGSADDAALNRAVARYTADPRAVAAFGADTNPDGRIAVPVLTVHGRDDPTAFVELEHAFRRTMEQAGTADHLVQTFTSDASHSYLSDAAYLTLLQALGDWARGGPKPTPAAIAARCLASQPAGECRFLPDYQPAPLATRLAPRD